jgi:hypothetical protein
VQGFGGSLTPIDIDGQMVPVPKRKSRNTQQSTHVYSLPMRTEKELLMNLSLRQTAILVALAFVLLVGLIGWTMSMAKAAAGQHTPIVHTGHVLADGGPGYICPPPPYVC